MTGAEAILRRWSSRIRTTDRQAYVAYVLESGAGDSERTPGNLGYQVLLRELDDGTTEITTLSWWESMDAVRGFAGPQPELARYYPEDDRFLLEHPKYVEHHMVVAGRVNVKV
ncbi:MAG: antibiotic biosynthesis monooxygenase [Vicinamibacteraceae bacterium]